MDVLPPELIRECLLRVPYTSHHNLAAVCRSWQAMVKSPQFYEDRKKFGISQQCICVTEMRLYSRTDIQYWINVYDPVQGTWEELPRLPHFPGNHQGIPYGCHCVCVNRKLVIIGGKNPNDQQRLYTVFIYDFSSAKWSRGTDIPLRAITTVCAVSPQGLVYVAGGIEIATRRAAVYNVEKNEWKLLPLMNEAHSDCFGGFIDGKFFVIGGFMDLLGGGLQQNAHVYDPEKGAWSTLGNMWTVWNRESPRPLGCALGSSDGLLYWFQTQQGVKVYDSKENVWRSVGSLPQTLGTITCCVAWRDRIFVNASPDNHFYMLMPPRTGAAESQDELVGEWSAIPIKSPQLSLMDFDQFIECADTFEI